MARKDKILMARQINLKRLRNSVRTEAAIRADVALNELAPLLEEEFDRRLAAGEPLELATFYDWADVEIQKQLGPVIRVT